VSVSGPSVIVHGHTVLLGSSFYLERDWDGVSEVDVDYVIEDLREAMRPATTTTQEDN
jgi:hypothetical protein